MVGGGMAENGNGRATTIADFIRKNAEDLWGDFKHTDFGKVILPFTLLRRLECVLEPTRQEVRDSYAAHKESGIDIDLILRQCTRYPFYNTSEYELGSLGGTKTRQNLQDYIAHFSDNARIIFEQFDFSNTIIWLDKAGVLFKICKNFAGVDLHPDVVPDRVMRNLYEHRIRRFGAEINEGAEDFMTPRDVVHLSTRCPPDERERAEIYSSFLDKGRSRGIVPTIDSLGGPEVVRRARSEWPTLEQEIGDLPDFDECLEKVTALDRALPWPEGR